MFLFHREMIALVLFGNDITLAARQALREKIQDAVYLQNVILVNFESDKRTEPSPPLQRLLRDHHKKIHLMSVSKASRESIFTFMCEHNLPFMNFEHRLFTYRTLSHLENIKRLNRLVKSVLDFLPEYILYFRLDSFLKNDHDAIFQQLRESPLSTYGLRRYEQDIEDRYFLLSREYFDIFYDRINEQLFPKLARGDITMDFPERILFHALRHTPLLAYGPCLSISLDVNVKKYELCTFEEEIEHYLSYISHHHKPFSIQKTTSTSVMPWVPVHYDAMERIEAYLQNTENAIERVYV